MKPMNIHVQSYPFLVFLGIIIIFVLATLLRKDRGAFLFESKENLFGKDKILRNIFYSLRNVMIVWAVILLFLRIKNNF